MQYQLTLRTIAEITRRFASTHLVGDEGKILTRALEAESFVGGVNLLRERFGYEVVRVTCSEIHAGDLQVNAVFTMGPVELFHLETIESKKGNIAIRRLAWSIPPVHQRRFRPGLTSDVRQSLVYLEPVSTVIDGQVDMKISTSRGFTTTRAAAAKVVVDSLTVVRKKILADQDVRELDHFIHLVREDAAASGVKLATKIPVPDALVVEESEFKQLREQAVSPFAV